MYLELGGNRPFIIFDDANLDQALTQFMSLKWRYAGQACITTNRLYVQASVHDKFLEMLVTKLHGLTLGHSAHKTSTMGPLTTSRGVEKANSLVANALGLGAKLVLGTGKGQGSPAAGGCVEGYFTPPTVLAEMMLEIQMSKEQLFAPVCGLYRFETEDEVVKWANNTSMGLASFAFNKNLDRMWRMLENLEAGMIGMNTGNSSAAESSFGSIKESGMGRRVVRMLRSMNT